MIYLILFVLIVAKCIVNADESNPTQNRLEVLIVAKCIVNLTLLYLFPYF